MTEDRERRLVDAFLAATDTLVADYDVVEMLQTLVEDVADLFGADAAGIMLANQQGELEVVASTSEESALLGLLQLESGEGPCVEAYREGTTIVVEDREEMRRRWAHFASEAERAGFAAVHSVPLRIGDTVLGSMNLFRTEPGLLDDRDALAARALTDVATISIMQQRSSDQAAVAQQQLQQALDSRVVIEQAKGFLAHTHRIEVDEAFALLRRHARTNRLRLHDVARDVVERRLVIPGSDVTTVTTVASPSGR